MATIEISISDDEKKWIDAQVAAGCYLNASDYIQELIRRDRQARQSLERALVDGESSGVSERTVNDVARQAQRRLRG